MQQRRHIFCFYSRLVRLEVTGNQGISTHRNCVSIPDWFDQKCIRWHTRLLTKITFLFQIGSIRSAHMRKAIAPHERFYSRLVRLEVEPNREKDPSQAGVSIPDWFDQKRNYQTLPVSLGCTFLFQIGSIRSEKRSLYLSLMKWFLFQIGSIRSQERNNTAQ